MSQQNKSVTDKMAELDDILAWFDGDDFNLNLALDKFEQAEKLAANIETDLKKLKNEINIVKKRFDQESA